MTSRASPASYHRLAVASRALAAIPINYALTSIATALLARHLPMAPAEATVTATLTSFLIFALIAMAIFHAQSTMRVWAWMIGGTTILGGLLALSISMGGRL